MDYIIGSDECGYGAVAGPFTVCAVAVPEGWKKPEGLRDSKKLSSKRIIELATNLESDPELRYCIRYGLVGDIDIEGVGKILLDAHTLALQTAIGMVKEERGSASRVVVDGNLRVRIMGWRKPFAEHVIRADDTIPAVMAASVIAKNRRDSYMRHLAEEYPGWMLEKHKGYLSPAHIQILNKRGPVKGLHRMSYEPCKTLYKQRNTH